MRARVDRLQAHQEADRLEAADKAWADAWARAPRGTPAGAAKAAAPAPSPPLQVAQAPASHRGPGTVVPSVTADLATAAPLFREEQTPAEPPLRPPKSPDDSEGRQEKVRRNFSNSLVASRTTSHKASPSVSPDAQDVHGERPRQALDPAMLQSPPPRSTEHYTIASPPGMGHSMGDLPHGSGAGRSAEHRPAPAGAEQDAGTLPLSRATLDVNFLEELRGMVLYLQQQGEAHEERFNFVEGQQRELRVLLHDQVHQAAESPLPPSPDPGVINELRRDMGALKAKLETSRPPGMPSNASPTWMTSTDKTMPLNAWGVSVAQGYANALVIAIASMAVCSVSRSPSGGNVKGR